jgi:hypothetical protein
MYALHADPRGLGPEAFHGKPSAEFLIPVIGVDPRCPAPNTTISAGLSHRSHGSSAFRNGAVFLYTSAHLVLVHAEERVRGERPRGFPRGNHEVRADSASYA